jgi:hypothetical protein
MSKRRWNKDKQRAAAGASGRRKKSAVPKKDQPLSPAEDKSKSAKADITPEKIEAPISLEDLFPPTLKKSWETESDARQAQNILSARQAYIRRGLVLTSAQAYLAQ